MNIHDSMKVRNDSGGLMSSKATAGAINPQHTVRILVARRLFAKAVRTLLAALAFVAFLGIGLAPGAAVAQGQQGRRPISLRNTAPLAPQATEASAQEADISEATRRGTKILRFDVSENAKRFVFDETPLFEDGLPAYGNEFVTEGYIYPYGTLTVADDGSVNGVNADGSPEFPDKVIGRWTCRGWHTGEGAKTVTGPWVVTHQLYDLGDKAGRVTLTTDGVELVDVNVPVQRAIIGGTGPYARARGEAVQTMLGFNQLGGVGPRFVLRATN